MQSRDRQEISTEIHFLFQGIFITAAMVSTLCICHKNVNLYNDQVCIGQF